MVAIKLTSFPLLPVAISLFATGAMFAQTGATSPSPGPPKEAPKQEQPAPTSAEIMRTGYLALVTKSIVPADPRTVANAALAAIAATAPERVRPLPAGFGDDAQRDAAWLAELVADLPPPWAALDAMARAAETAHVAFGTPQRRKGIGARMAGKPLATPGFSFCALADGRLVVFDVVKGASAETSGLRAGDVLRRIDGKRAIRFDGFVLNSLPAGTELTLDIERANQPMTIILRLIQTEQSPVESRLLDDGIAYVQIRWFSRAVDAGQNTAALARREFTSLAAQGARGLIIDLRSGLGGSGEVSIVSALCDADIIYSVRQPVSSPARPVKREGERIWPDRPIVILINEQTVSAGESLALAARELARATIVGRTSGGGLTELSFVPLAEGYSMNIPTGVVLGPLSGEDQPGHAVKPDIDVPNPTIEELLSGRDRQLDAARAVILGTKVP